MSSLFPETPDTPENVPHGKFSGEHRMATPEDVAELLREEDDANATAAYGHNELPTGTVIIETEAVTPATPAPASIADEIAAAEALLTPEQRAARAAARSPFVEPKEQRVDRSRLQRWRDCPHQAAHLEQRQAQELPPPPPGQIARVGSAVHDAISQTINDYLDNPEWKPQDVRETLLRYALDSPADVQPDVMDTLRYSVWSLASMIAEISPRDILGFDGGPMSLTQLDRSGQIAATFRHPQNWVGTLELDLWFRTASPTIIQVVDYKCGYKNYYPSTIAGTFQFRFAALIIFLNYPDCQEVHFVVWSPNTGGKTQPVVFKRAQMHEWQAEVEVAAHNLFSHQGKPPEQVPALPSEEKCNWCPVARNCRLAWEPAKEIADDPVAFAEKMFVMEKGLAQMKKTASAYVKKTGQDIVSPNGPAVGFKRPKRKSSPRLDVYEIKAAAEAAESSDDAGEGDAE